MCTLQVNSVYTSSLVIKKIKGQTIIFNEENFENKVFKIGFMHLKKKKNSNWKQNSPRQKCKNQLYTSYAESF